MRRLVKLAMSRVPTFLTPLGHTLHVRAVPMHTSAFMGSNCCGRAVHGTIHEAGRMHSQAPARTVLSSNVNLRLVTLLTLQFGVGHTCARRHSGA